MIKNRYYNYILKYYDPNKEFIQRDFSTNIESLTTSNTMGAGVLRGGDEISEFLNLSEEAVEDRGSDKEDIWLRLREGD